MSGCDESANDIENQHNALEASIIEDLERLSALPCVSRLFSDCCIYRVPEQTRRLCVKAYTPQLVSIGPFHHGNAEVMEDHKIRYLRDFLNRTELSLRNCLKIIKDHETSLRSCYAETIEFNSDDFVRLILVDAVFIVEVFLSFAETGNDSISQLLRIHDFTSDLLLLENQLPFFIIEVIFKSVKASDETRTSIMDLALHFFQRTTRLAHCEVYLNTVSFPKVDHFVDLLRNLNLPSCSEISRPVRHITIPSMTELYWAGVRFVVELHGIMCDIRFENGILKVPEIYLDVDTARTLKNVIAFERCHCKDLYINDYVSLINDLARTPTDVELLVQHGILRHSLRDNHEGYTLIKQLEDGTVRHSLFDFLSEELNDYCKKKKRLASWRQYLYKKRWQTFSISAVLLVVLTIIQTVFSGISTMPQPPRRSL